MRTKRKASRHWKSKEFGGFELKTVKWTGDGIFGGIPGQKKPKLEVICEETGV